MNSLYTYLTNHLPRFSASSFYQEFVNRFNEGSLIQKENPASHFATFFLPVHKPTRSVYFVHHRKANLWIPPGGHIEPGENPEQTVKREFPEELSHILTDEKIDFFDITITDVSASKNPCKMHYDLWYAVYMREKVDFVYDKGEFFTACWLLFDSAVNINPRSHFKNVLQHLFSIINK